MRVTSCPRPFPIDGRWPRASFRAGCSRHNRTAARGRRHLATCASEDNGFACQLRLSLQGTHHQSSGNQLRSQSPTCTSSNDRWCCSGKSRCRDKRASGPGRNSPRRHKRFVRSCSPNRSLRRWYRRARSRSRRPRRYRSGGGRRRPGGNPPQTSMRPGNCH